MGKRALAQAAQRCGDAITVRYRRRPFILRPERIGMEPWLGVLRKLGVSRGNPGWVNSFVPAMVAKGKQLGIAFDFGGNVGNSLDSLRLLHFAVAAGGGISVSKLFLAGVLPGILMCVSLAIAAWVMSIRHNYPAEPFPGWKVVGRAALDAVPGFFTAVIIVGGTLSGVFTVTESGAFGAIYALLLTTFYYRSLTWEGFRISVVGAVRTTAMVMILIAFASSFAYLLALYQVPAKLSDLLVTISENPIVILLMINVILLILGMIMDMAALILICTPIFLPIAKGLGMDPTQFGIMMLINLGIGLCTPPVGTCLFVGCAVGRIKIEEAMKSIWPFYLAILIALLLVTYVPAVSLWLPSVLLQ